MRAGRPMSKDAMIDCLKFTFNLLLQYPRMMQAKAKEAQEDPANKPVLGDLWDDKFAPYVHHRAVNVPKEGLAFDMSILHSAVSCPFFFTSSTLFLKRPARL